MKSTKPGTPHPAPTAHPFSEEFRQELWRLFRERRDVRRFRTDEVPFELIEQILDAAHLAPSVGLSQPWRFVLVDSVELRAEVIGEFERCNRSALIGYQGSEREKYGKLKLAGLREAPYHILVCAAQDPEQGKRLGRTTQPETLRSSAVCAIQNMWLAASALGLGIGWVSILEPGAIRASLQIPEDWDWVGYLCVGWPQSYESTPELERSRWESRRPVENVIFRR